MPTENKNTTAPTRSEKRAIATQRKIETLDASNNAVSNLGVKLSASVMRDIVRDFESGGKRAIQSLRRKSPDKYMAIVISLMPKGVLTEDSDGNVTATAEGVGLDWAGIKARTIESHPNKRLITPDET